jgi:hypothetical protein
LPKACLAKDFDDLGEQLAGVLGVLVDLLRESVDLTFQVLEAVEQHVRACASKLIYGDVGQLSDGQEDTRTRFEPATLPIRDLRLRI